MLKDTVAPIFIKNSNDMLIENCHNNIVVKAIQNVISSVFVGKMTVEDLKSDVHQFLDSITRPAITQKANSIFYVKLMEKDSPIIPFMEKVKNDYEEILHSKHSMFSKDVLEKINSKLLFNLSPELFYDIHNPNFADPSVWFSKRTSLYNPAVNFEHVCYMVDLMLENTLKPSVEILAPFYYFVKLWAEYDEFSFVIYHLIKLIRVSIYSKYYRGAFSPVNSFVNIRFGAITDQNIEVYGDVKLSDNPDDILSLFTLCPRTPVVKSNNFEDIIVYDWNGLNKMTKLFTHNSRQDIRPGLPLPVFLQMEKLDITPRISSAKHKKVNYYSTVFIDDFKLLCTSRENLSNITNELFREMARDILRKIPTAKDNKSFSKYDNHTVYVMFTDSHGRVNTVSTHNHFSILRELIQNNHIPQAKIKMEHREYIPQVSGSFSMANREIITPNSVSWENLWRTALNIPVPPPKSPV